MAGKLDKWRTHQLGYLMMRKKNIDANQNWEYQGVDEANEELVEERYPAPLWYARVDDNVK